jgi:hypothetical protein
MTKKMRQTIIIFFVGITFMSCASNEQNVNSVNAISQTNDKQQAEISLDTFTTIPKEIDGCSCYFYLSETDKNANKYIFVNDFAKIAFVTVNGKLEKFEIKEHKKNSKIYLYSNKSFDLKVEITKEEPGGEEASNMEGSITITKQGAKLIKNFVGSCGC